MPDNRPPPFPGPPPSPSENTGLNLYRDPRRVGILTFFADPFYTIWWLWQFFKFAQREKFPRARSFWWLLVPIYGLVVLYRELEDLKKAAADLPSVRSFNPGLVIALIVLDNVVVGISSRLNSPGPSLVTFLISGLLAAAALYLAQGPASAYLKNKYPDAPARGFTWGEIVATVVGALLFAANLIAVFVPSS